MLSVFPEGSGQGLTKRFKAQRAPKDGVGSGGMEPVLGESLMVKCVVAHCHPPSSGQFLQGPDW